MGRTPTRFKLAFLRRTLAVMAIGLATFAFDASLLAQAPKPNGQLPQPQVQGDNGWRTVGVPRDACAQSMPTQESKPVRDFIKVSATDSGFDIIVGQGRVLTTSVDIAAPGDKAGAVAVGDPSVVDFAILGKRQVRLIGKKIGVSDVTVVTADGQLFTLEVRVMADLPVLQCQLQALFPDASIKLSQIRDAIVVEGQARDVVQSTRIIQTVRRYVDSLVNNYPGQSGSSGQSGQQPGVVSDQRAQSQVTLNIGERAGANQQAGQQSGQQSQQDDTTEGTRVINLLTVPGTKQVLLKVRIAELNRTAFRQIGTDLLYHNPGRATFGTQIAGTTSETAASGIIDILRPTTTTAFGIFNNADFAIVMSALRRNELLKILAEPNLVAMSGHAANFLAGGEFPVPVPQASGGAGITPTVTVQFKEFGVKLGFLPTILDGDVIRMSVDPEVSSIDFAIGTTLVVGGTPVPGLNVRRAHTVVEMKEGQTLAMAGLLQLTLDGRTRRIPGLGDLPVLGPFFSNTEGSRVEKELIVLVTPYLVEPMNQCQVGPVPGDDVKTPTDLEFYLYNQIEGQRVDWRATTEYQCRTNDTKRLLRLEAAGVRGPHGFCE